MAVILGEATVNGAQVTIAPPSGFGGISAVRISNYTGDALILTNIIPDRPGSEYLLPFQQNVYAAENIRNAPTISALQLGAGFDVAAVLIEWSTEPLADFPGTYPQNLVQASLTGGLASPAWEVHTLAVPDDGTTHTLAGDQRRTSLSFLVQNADGTLPTSGVHWSHHDSSMTARPVVLPGDGRSLDTTADIYFRAVSGADSAVQWFETRYGPGIVT